MVYDPRPKEFASTTQQEVNTLSQKLVATAKNPALLHLIPTDCHLPIEPRETLPPSPTLLRDQEVHRLATLQHPLHYSSIGQACRTFLESIQYAPAGIAAVESATRQQRYCRRWQEERQYRITASRFGTVIKRRRNFDTLVKQLLYTSFNSSGVSALVWGQHHEEDALEQYRQTLMSGHSLHRAGLFVRSCGFLDASPDAVVKDESGDIVRVVEVTCPYKARNKTIEEMLDGQSFFCYRERQSNRVTLKTSHDYYHQFQGQMGITGVHHCDFVIWTPIDFLVLRVDFDREFWTSHCYPKLKSFFLYFMLPEIVYPKYPNSPTDYSYVQLYT